jgi:hypothetical protein
MSGATTPAVRYWYIAFPATVIGWILFKCCYPYADFFTDSYSYIQAAAVRDAVSYRPIGYSLFLRLVHGVSHSDTLLVTIQFLLVQSSCWLLFATVCRRCAPGAAVQALISGFLILNPLVYYISNFVSSDALFMALSLFWLTSLIRSMDAPGWRGLVIQWILLLGIFYLRYVALFYPVVAAICYCWMPRGWWFRLTAMAGSVLVVGAAVLVTREQTRMQTGAPTFSAFSGWQMANNALHIYPWLPVDSTVLPPATQPLAGYVKLYFDRLGEAMRKNPPAATTAYMWDRSSPLHQYLAEYRRPHSKLRQAGDTAQLSYYTAWNRVGPVFSEYGYSLLRRHPLAFGRYYLVPSAGSFFLSPLDVFNTYLDGKKEIDAVGRLWFGYRKALPRVCSATMQGRICAPFPWLSLIMTVAFAVLAGIFVVRREVRDRYPAFTGCMRVAGVYLGVNFCFSVFASPSVYRYQVLPLILLVIFTGCGFFVVNYRKQSNHV